MPNTLHANVRCPVCGEPPLMITHHHHDGVVDNEYLHREGPDHVVRRSCWEQSIQETLDATEESYERIKRFVSQFRIFCLPQPRDPDGEAIMGAIKNDVAPGSIVDMTWNPPPSPPPPTGLIEATTKIVMSGKSEQEIGTGILSLWRSMARRGEPPVRV